MIKIKKSVVVLMADILSKITEEYNSFTHSQKVVANYVMENYNLIAFDTLDDLAQRIKVSTTTIIRFSRSLGYNGYTDMQRDIQAHLKDKISLPERLTSSTEQVQHDQILKEAFQNDINNINETLQKLSMEELQKAVQQMCSARCIYLLGMRGSFSLAYYAASRFGQLRHNVHLIQSAGMLYPEEISNAGPEDLCIAFFFPRYSKTTASMISWLRKKQTPIILITGQSHHSISSYGDLIFPCSIKGSSVKNSYAAPVCLINYFTAALARENHHTAKKVLEETEELLNQGYYLGM